MLAASRLLSGGSLVSDSAIDLDSAAYDASLPVAIRHQRNRHRSLIYRRFASPSDLRALLKLSEPPAPPTSPPSPSLPPSAPSPPSPSPSPPIPLPPLTPPLMPPSQPSPLPSLPPPSLPSLPPCSSCTDVPSPYISMSLDGLCAAFNSWAKNCIHKDAWIAAQYCRRSCFFAGHGYDGDI